MTDKCSPSSEAVLGSEASNGKVKGMIGEEKFGATADHPETEARTTVLEARTFTAKISGELTLLGAYNAGD
jgi:hypothetical protein